MSTLTEAINHGRGVERPFRCTEHEDHMASASVNVLKGVWFCYACHAKGNVDKKRTPKVDELKIMMEPNKLPRIYDPYFLELYSDPGYWLSRFTPEGCWSAGLGSDPFSGDAIFPVHTSSGLLAGVGRRRNYNTGDREGPKYIYPKHWSAASSVFGMGGLYPQTEMIVLVEGAADATALIEVGMGALAVYGSGVHLPQYELIARCSPKLLLVGFDMDEAGDRAAQRAINDMSGFYAMSRVHWPANDPASCTPDQRIMAVHAAVVDAGYPDVLLASSWFKKATSIRKSYERSQEEQ